MTTTLLDALAPSAPDHVVGVVTGVVTNNEDPEALGRVKVKFPSLTEDDESTWAKVLSPGAGSGGGMQCIPEVGDEVLVGFEHDDKRRPVVLGGLWNGKDGPPGNGVRNGKVQARSWVSRSGNSIEMSDEEGGPAVIVKAGGSESELHVEKEETRLAGEDKVVVTGREIEVRAARKLVLKGAQVELLASGDLKIAGATVRIN